MKELKCVNYIRLFLPRIVILDEGYDQCLTLGVAGGRSTSTNSLDILTCPYMLSERERIGWCMLFFDNIRKQKISLQKKLPKKMFSANFCKILFLD